MNSPQMHDEFRPYRLAWLPAIAIGSSLALLVWPGTRRVIQSQARLTIPTDAAIASASPLGFGDHAASAAILPDLMRSAAAHDIDLGVQIAMATEVPDAQGILDNGIRIARLRNLLNRFPNSPELYGTLTRYETGADIHVNRDDAASFLRDYHKLPRAAGTQAADSTAALQLFDADCDAGERLDPRNAYFPVMRALGLFEQQRDEEALAELDRAAGCQTWTEYLNTQIYGCLRLQEATLGPAGPLPLAGFGAEILLPHLASIRNAACVAIYDAAKAESSGDVSRGVQIRGAVRRVGSLMRSDSPTLIGTLIGMRLVHVSLMRPFAAPAPPKADLFKDTQAMAKLVRSFDDYLAGAGRTDLIDSVDKELASCAKTRRIITEGMGQSVFDNELISVIEYSIGDMILLGSIIWLVGMTLFSITMSAISRKAGLRRRFGALHRSLMLLVGSALAAGMVAGLVALSHRSIGCFAQIGSIWFGPEGDSTNHLGLAMMCDGYTGIVAVVPALTLFSLVVMCLCWKTPVAAGVTRGLRGCVIPICALLLMAYNVAVPVTAFHESRLQYGLDQTCQHEGDFMAGLVGETWPGPTD